MIHHVIVPIDGSEHADAALGPATELAGRIGATLVLLQAVHPDDVELGRAELNHRAERSGLDAVEILLDSMNGPVGALSEAVEARPGALICMTTHGRGGLGRALFGSVAEEALREVGGPVLLVGPSFDPAATTIGPILVPLDGSHRAEAILPVAAEWSRRFGFGLRLVEVIDPADAERAQVAGTDVHEGAYLQRVAGSLPADLPTTDWEVLHDADPARAIVDDAARHACRVVALTTHGRTGLARMVAGSVATRIVHDHAGLVLVLRSVEPDDD